MHLRREAQPDGDLRGLPRQFQGAIGRHDGRWNHIAVVQSGHCRAGQLRHLHRSHRRCHGPIARRETLRQPSGIRNHLRHWDNHVASHLCRRHVSRQLDLAAAAAHERADIAVGENIRRRIERHGIIEHRLGGESRTALRTCRIGGADLRIGVSAALIAAGENQRRHHAASADRRRRYGAAARSFAVVIDNGKHGAGGISSTANQIGDAGQ